MPATIFSDLQQALKAIQHTDTTPYNENWFLRNLIYQKAKELRRNGHLVAIRWIPGHSGWMGNEKADLPTKNRAQTKGENKLKDGALLHTSDKNMTETRARELIQWHQAQTQERETSRRGFYIPWRHKSGKPLLSFLQRTEIAGREGARERELEWERKNDQAGEDLLG